MVIADSSPSYQIPNLLEMVNFPWPGTHTGTEQANADSVAWLSSYEPYGNKGDTAAFFARTQASILGGYTYPYTTYEKMRACMDFINVIYVLDEITDLQSGTDARKTMDNHLDVLFGGTGDDSPITKFTIDLRKRLHETFAPATLPRLFESYKKTILEMVTEAENRERNKILNFEDYKQFRLTQGATYPVFDLIECCFDYVLPDEVMNDKTFKALREEAMSIIIWTNDICSYNNEQSKEGHAYANVITVLMNEQGINLQEAMDLIGDQTNEHFRKYKAYKAQLPSFGETIDTEVQNYVHGMDCWVAGEIHYCFNIPKYFADELDKVKQTLVVKLIA